MDVKTVWNDKRLCFDAESPKHHIVMQGNGLSAIWEPDIMIAGEKGVLHETFPANLSTASIFPNGDVSTSKRCPSEF